MADEFDLKPTSRGEEFLDVILRSLGGDTPDIPQPAWRYEEYLAAIANAIQNGGGGSSGGGVLVVQITNPEGGVYVADKTYNEVLTAYQSGQPCLFSLYGSSCVVSKDEDYPELYGFVVTVNQGEGGSGTLWNSYIEYTTSGVTVDTTKYSLTEEN